MWGIRKIGTDVGNLDLAQRRSGSDFSALGAPDFFLTGAEVCLGSWLPSAWRTRLEGRRRRGSEAAGKLLKRDSTEILGGL